MHARTCPRVCRREMKRYGQCETERTCLTAQQQTRTQKCITAVILLMSALNSVTIQVTMKAITRQRPKNANYSVAANPTHTKGAPLNAKPRIRNTEKLTKPVQQEKKPKDEGGGGGKMTKFRSLDDIPDFTDDFGKDKYEIEAVDSPQGAPSHYDYHNSQVRGKKPPHVVNSGYSVGGNRGPPPPLRGPPLLPAEERYQASPQSLNPRQNQAVDGHDNNSCASVDTDLDDGDNDDENCNQSFFSSTDDYHVDYVPSRNGANHNNGVAQKSRVVRSAKAVQNSYPLKRPTSQNDSSPLPKEPIEITYKPYTIQQYRKIKPQEYVEFSKLKPDLNTTELVAKRANAERIKQFSKNLNDFNRVSIKHSSSAGGKEAKPRALSNREKAHNFAQNVPKPKVNEKKSVACNSKITERNIGVSSARPSNLDELTSRHQQSKKQVEAIKKSMGIQRS